MTIKIIINNNSLDIIIQVSPVFSFFQKIVVCETLYLQTQIPVEIKLGAGLGDPSYRLTNYFFFVHMIPLVSSIIIIISDDIINNNKP